MTMHEHSVKRLFISIICLTLLATTFRRYVLDIGDPFHCAALLNEGQWLDKPSQRPPRRAFQNWQPPGCLLHEYIGADIKTCAGNRELLFVGDSNVRQLFWTVAKKLNHHNAIEMASVATRHGDIQYQEGGVSLRFIWDPYLNGSVLANELEIYSENVGAGFSRAGKKKGEIEQDVVFLVLGGGLWHARQFETEEAVRSFKNSVNNIIMYTQRDPGKEWKAQDPFSGYDGVGDQVFFLPVEVPVYERLSPARQQTIMPEEVNQMNEYLRRLTHEQGLIIPWVNQVMTGTMKYAYEQSGIHVVESIANRRADIILNFRCNAKIDNAIGSPYERTCCSKYSSGNWFQWFLIATSLIVLPTITLLPRANRLEASADLRSILPPLTVIGLAMAYSFVADRSQLFTKARKVYHLSELVMLTMFAFAVGLLTIRKTKEAQMRRSSTKEVFVTMGPAFLSREQTDEWKGWMQIIVLLYHWTAADTQLSFYILLRLVIASYLFITTYGHTMHFYRQQDYTLRRLADVIIRLNCLPVLMSYQMYNNYLFYIFPPLATFWFLVTFGTLRFGAELNGKPGFLLAKLVLSASLIYLSHTHAEPTDTIFGVFRWIFSINWNGGDWRRFVILDIYVPYFGMLVALLHVWYQKAANSSLKGLDRDERLATSLLLAAVEKLRPWVVALSLAVLPIFSLLVSRSPDQNDFNWWAACISPLPVLSYVVLRNAHPLLRDHYSIAFAWLGRCSLETWTLSYHILRAADGKGVLGIGLFNSGDGSLFPYRWRDAVLIVPLLLWTAWQVSCAKRRLAAWSLSQPGLGKKCVALVAALWILNLVTS
ncbi:hypothetical protein, variant [Verruconis gallopava]|nr:hypothetical protein, variant [Verruconis gallopava]KIW04771.1 hypothetical protein, variant [Verruconis gallopava]